MSEVVTRYLDQRFSGVLGEIQELGGTVNKRFQNVESQIEGLATKAQLDDAADNIAVIVQSGFEEVFQRLDDARGKTKKSA